MVRVERPTGAYELLEQLRWGGRPQTCPLCGAATRCYFLQPRGGDTRATRTGAATGRRVWKCGACRRQFSVLAGTILEGTRIPLPVWVAAMRDWTDVGRLAPGELTGRHGMSRAAARHITRRLELASGRLAGAPTGTDLLTALLQLPAAEAAAIRQRTPTRVRPRPQRGPSADYGVG